MPTAPMTGAIRSSAGGNSSASASRSAGARSMPVMAATRALRFSASATWPDTPALRRTIDTASATPLASTTPADASVAHRQRLDHLGARRPGAGGHERGRRRASASRSRGRPRAAGW